MKWMTSMRAVMTVMALAAVDNHDWNATYHLLMGEN
jgi:hypothetical protein